MTLHYGVFREDFDGTRDRQWLVSVGYETRPISWRALRELARCLWRRR